MPVFALLLIAGLPLAAADVPVAPPMDLQATAVAEGVQLTWSAPIDASAGTTYSVYRDGVLVESGIQGLSHVDAPMTTMSGSATVFVYAVTAVNEHGETLPAIVAFVNGCIHLFPGSIPPIGIEPEDCLP